MSNNNDVGGLSTAQFALLTLLAVAAVVLATINVMAKSANGVEKHRFAQRQQFIVQTNKLRKVGSELVKTTAQVAIKSQDKELSDLLGNFGFTIKKKETTEGATP